jgi:phenylpropionate dioxygenase-like ring-hydroxylating dioxygenase large terminal subunit
VDYPTTVAPIAAGELESALRPFGQGTMLPAVAYTSTEILAWERRHMFAGSWECLGRDEDLRHAGDGRPVTQRGLHAGDVPVLVTFPSNGAVLALANTCRHRGHEILPAGAADSRKALICPYHAWNYALDGSLVKAPGFDRVPGFEAAEYGLVRLPTAVWHGWVFVNAIGNGPSLADHVGDLDTLVAPYHPETLLRQARLEYEVAANWKVVVENYHECYHCPRIHPELCRVSPPTSGANFDLPGSWVGGSMGLRAGATTMSLSGASDATPIDGVDPRVVLYLGLFPNLLISLHPDYVMTHRLTPLAPALTRVECTWYFVDDTVDPSYAVEFWDLTNRQDWAACESVQRGLSSPHFRPGPFAPNEDAVHRWVTMVARAYLGATPPTVAQ